MAGVDQLTNVREMAAQQKRATAKIITVLSGKGGVGKTNLALNMSMALQDAGKDVALFDADVHFSDIHLLAGEEEKGVLADVASGRESLNKLEITRESGLKIISAPSGVETSDMFDEYIKEEFFKQIYQYKTSHDYIVIDTGAGLSQTIVDFARLADETIVVITPEPAAVSDGYAMIKVLSRLSQQMTFSVVINLAETKDEAEEVYERFSLVVEHFLGAPVHYLGYILFDKQVRKAVRSQQPLLQFNRNSSAARSITHIAGRFIT